MMPDMVWGRYPTDQIVERMIDLMDQYKPLHWWAERGHIIALDRAVPAQAHAGALRSSARSTR